MSLTFEQRFWARVRKTKGCWLWTGARTAAGYGLLQRDGKLVYAHRAAWEMASSRSLQASECVLHDCDNPPCVRHLRVGTQKDNVRDMHAKGRAHKASGAANGKFKLTEATLQFVRQLSAEGLGCRAIGRRLGISHSYISRILSGERRAR